MQETVCAVVGLLAFIAMIIAASLYHEGLKTERFSICMTAVQEPSVCALVIK